MVQERAQRLRACACANAMHMHASTPCPPSSLHPPPQGEGPAATLPPDPLPAVLCASHFGERDGLLRTVGRKLREPLAAPTPALFWAAGFSFSRAQLMHEASRRCVP